MPITLYFIKCLHTYFLDIMLIWQFWCRINEMLSRRILWAQNSYRLSLLPRKFTFWFSEIFSYSIPPLPLSCLITPFSRFGLSFSIVSMPCVTWAMILYRSISFSIWWDIRLNRSIEDGFFDDLSTMTWLALYDYLLRLALRFSPFLQCTRPLPSPRRNTALFEIALWQKDIFDTEECL